MWPIKYLKNWSFSMTLSFFPWQLGFMFPVPTKLSPKTELHTSHFSAGIFFLWLLYDCFPKFKFQLKYDFLRKSFLAMLVKSYGLTSVVVRNLRWLTITHIHINPLSLRVDKLCEYIRISLSGFMPCYLAWGSM